MYISEKDKLKDFLLEDIGTGDLSTNLIFESTVQSSGEFVAKEDGVIAGLYIPNLVYGLLGDDAKFKSNCKDGDIVKKGDIIGCAVGNVRTLLTGERVILNLMQRMSGIATQTKNAIHLLNDPQIRICDTRKTSPGLRIFDKQAVRIGGGFNHRMGLYDGVMLKDNHIAFSGSMTLAVNQLRTKLGQMVKIEVEVETRAQVDEAIALGVDIIMFDNRTPKEVKEWTKIVPKSIITELSGGITVDNIADYNGTGVNYISLGALTHSVKAMDISFNSSKGPKKRSL